MTLFTLEVCRTANKHWVSFVLLQSRPLGLLLWSSAVPQTAEKLVCVLVSEEVGDSKCAANSPGITPKEKSFWPPDRTDCGQTPACLPAAICSWKLKRAATGESSEESPKLHGCPSIWQHGWAAQYGLRWFWQCCGKPVIEAEKEGENIQQYSRGHLSRSQERWRPDCQNVMFFLKHLISPAGTVSRCTQAAEVDSGKAMPRPYLFLYLKGPDDKEKTAVSSYRWSCLALLVTSTALFICLVIFASSLSYFFILYICPQKYDVSFGWSSAEPGIGLNHPCGSLPSGDGWSRASIQLNPW